MDKKQNTEKRIERVKDRGDLRKTIPSKQNNVEVVLKDRGDSKPIINHKIMKPKDRGDSRLIKNITLLKPNVDKKKHTEDTKIFSDTQKKDSIRKGEDFKRLSNQKIKSIDNKTLTADVKNKMYSETSKKSLVIMAEEIENPKIVTNQNSKVTEESKGSDTSKKSLPKIIEENTQNIKQNVEKKNTATKKDVRKKEENVNQKQKTKLNFDKKSLEDSKNSESSRKSLIKMVEVITDYSTQITNQLIKANVDNVKVTEDNIDTSMKDLTRLIEEITNRKAKMSVEKKKDVKNDKKEETAPNRTYLDLEGRKKLRERYTLRLKNSQNLNKSDVKVDTKENEIIVTDKKLDEEPAKDKSNESSKESDRTEPKTVKEPSRRKPIIKTVTVKNDNRVYKAVTFVDQKQHTPLEIKIPNYKKQKVREVKIKLSKVRLKGSKESIKPVIKKVKVKRRGRRPRVLSPEFLKGNASPPTEVAKWAPSCINHHTKPYYEAWVDTTLAAISKCSKKDKLYLEKQNLIKTFKRALEERPDTPDLVYEKINDERYTGRIKVRQR